MEVKCKNCGKENREIAKFCRFCGSQIEVKVDETESQNPVKPATEHIPEGNPVTPVISSEYVGLKDIKDRLNKYISLLNIEKEQKKMGINIEKNTTVIVFRGETGSGKSLVANCFINDLKKSKALDSDRVERLSAKAFQRAYKDEFAISQYLTENRPGILLLDEVQVDTNYLHEILTGLTNSPSETICILLGTKEPLDNFFEEHPEDIQRVSSFYDFPNISDNDLCEILERKIAEAGFTYGEEVKDSLLACIQAAKKDVTCVYKNGWLVEKEILKKIRAKQASRLQQNFSNLKKEDYVKILPEDLPVIAKKLTKEEILKELNELIGMDDVKKAIQELMQTIEMNKEREAQGLAGKVPAIHIVFTGNPGTGKTTVARILGKLFFLMKLLPTDNVVETDRSGLVAQYVGQTAPMVNAMCDKAMGGVLFIDEAYTLAGDTFGKEAIDTLLKRMEDDRGKFVVIAAGYKKEMENFIQANPGLKSRFTHYIHLEDYNTDELFQLFRLYAKKADYTLDPMAAEIVYTAIEDMVKNKTKDFANGRTIRNFFDEITRKMNARVALLPPEKRTKETMVTILSEDVPYTQEKKISVDDILQQLDELIGMADVKKAVRELCQTIQMNKEREAQGLAGKLPSIHIVFTGNPGTGKTTVARILGKLFNVMQLLPTDNVVETDRSGLVAQYVGQTAPLVNMMCDKAMGGVLFIDEAYTLAGDTFGKEAIDALLKRMEDDRGKFVVIAAGYKNEMEDFIQANPGLKSRFTHFIHLEDYNPGELFDLFKLYAKKGHYTITSDAETIAREQIEAIWKNRGRDFANGRTIRNFFDETTRRMDTRIAALPAEQRNVETLTTITADDFSKGGDQ